MELIRLSHCVYQCDYHIVLVTKYRRKIFNDGIFAYIDKKLAEITEHYPLIRFKAVNHDKDHIHFLVSIPSNDDSWDGNWYRKTEYSSRVKAKIPVLEEGILGHGCGMVGRVFRLHGRS